MEEDGEIDIKIDKRAQTDMEEDDEIDRNTVE